MILCFVIIFFFAHTALFSLKLEHQASGLESVQYCYTSRDKISYADIRLQTAEGIDDIHASASNKYLYIRGTLPQAEGHRLVLRQLNATARISVSGNEIFDTISEKAMSGSSYITVELPDNASGETIELLLHSPLSDSFEIEIIPAGETIFSALNIPYSFFYIALLFVAVFVVSLILCLTHRGGCSPEAIFLLFASALVAFSVFLFEYWPMHNEPHFLFALKLFLSLLVPAVILIEIAVRHGEWNTGLEAMLAINVLYALCAVILWGNVFFFILLRAGVILQAINTIFAMRIILRRAKRDSKCFCSAVIVFWTFDILLWIAISSQKLTWQSIAFVAAALLCCLGYAADAVILRREKKARDEGSHASTEGARRVTERIGSDEYDPTPAHEWNREEAELKNVSLKISPDMKIPNNCLAALDAFNQRIFNKVYIRETHSLNVSEYSRIIGSYMGMSKSRADEISRAAALHDIGKICVPDDVLFKSGRLSEAEFEEIKRHIVYGYQLLNCDDEFFRMAALVAREHHEHVDGSGYMGLRGSEISLPAKIVAVSDVFDALVSERSYKESWSFEDAFAYISEHADDYFDKAVVEAFVGAKHKIYELYCGGFCSDLSNNTEERN